MTPITTRGNDIRTASPTVRRLFEIAHERGMSGAAISTHAGVTSNMAHYWKTGKSSPSIMSLEQLADALGMEIAVVPKDRTKTLEDKLRERGIVISIHTDE